MQIGREFKIDFSKVSEQEEFSITVKTLDRKRYLDLFLVNNNEIINLNNYSVTVRAKKTDGTEIFNDVIKTSPENGKCRIEITEQMLNFKKVLPCEIVLYGADGTVASSSYFLLSNIVNRFGEEIKNSNEFTALEEALVKVTNLDSRLLNILKELSKKINQGECISAGQIIGGITENQLAQSVIDMITGKTPVSSQVKEKSIDYYKLARNAIGVPEASFLKSGKNLYDKSRRSINKIIQGSLPSTYNITDHNNYDITDFIYVEMGKTYTCNTGARSLYLLNVAGECIEVITTNLNSSTSKFSFTASQTGYIRASLYKQYAETWQLEEGDDPTRYEDYKRYFTDDILENIKLKKKQIIDFRVESDDCSFFQVGKNLFNPDKFLNRKLISKNNTIVDNSKYIGYMIELEPGTYTVSSKTRNVFQFDSNLSGKGLISTISDVTSDKPITFTIDVKSWIGINFFADAIDMQLEKGNHATKFEPYNYTIDKLNFTNNQIQKIKDGIINDKLNNDPNLLKIIKNNNQYTIYSKLNNKETIKYETEIEDVRNNCFNFVDTYLIKNNKEILIHDQGDDITPIRTFYTIGANHGYPCFSIPINGQTTADIGTTWTDGTTDYVLADVENNKCIFLYPYTENEHGIINYSNINPIARLTSKTNTSNSNVLEISKLVIEQFYPSVNKHTYNVELDGKNLIDGINFGEEFNITEKYNILCYKALHEYLKNNVGKKLLKENLNTIDGVIELCINYKFKNNALVLINHTLKALKKVTLGNCGFLQSVRLNPNTSHYIPNVKPKGVWDFSQLTNINSYKDNLKFYINDCINQKYPINRYVQHRNDADDNKIGFTAGYLPDIGNGANEERLKISTLWDFRSTKKSYPVGYSGGTLEPGAYMNFSMYRKYIATSELKDGETNKTYMESGDSLYVFIDIHKNTVCDNLELPLKYIDKPIKVLEQSEGFELVNNTVDVRGVNYNIKNNYGYAVLKI
ncbi:MAG: hypothetical protein ACI3VR_14945, partial [Intestinibacter sp.]|uniref:hypothetical protein n=1 Tax=Intestinibacter sp. TaxID=1965304 RepID=UPI003F184CE1